MKDIGSEKQIDELWVKYSKLREGANAQKCVGQELGQLLVEESELCYALKNKIECEKKSLHCDGVPTGWLSRGRCRQEIAEPIGKVSLSAIADMFQRLRELKTQRTQHKKSIEKSVEWQF